jgi:hypothetical protein
MRASREIAERGTFERCGDAEGYAAINALFRAGEGRG